MARYALLVLPAMNRVYADASVGLTMAELAAFDASVLGGKVFDIRETVIGGVPYVSFEADEIGDKDAAFLANMSSVFALFRIEGGLLAPVELRSLDKFDDDLLTIQKYQGKTNEHFTKLLLNVTLLATSSAREMLDRKFALVDPLCGRGTTLNQGLMYGFDVAGLDIDKKDFEAYSTFLQTWLKRKRLKHTAEVTRIRREHKTLGQKLEVSVGVTKEDYKAGNALRLTYVNADTTKATSFYRPGTFDLAVADAPYGVQHGSRTEQHGLARNPLDLVREAAPGWAALLKPGGALGLSWNVNVARRDALTRVLADAGLEPVEAGPYLNFAHRVDQAIVRDIVVARRP
ncbi:SAM-dependent methyltransferase [Nocardia terpenica]|uniref:TRM11 family SAM-dependent methyltransferase n=1 Tax=Nocardia terpenica TaxID=455432 RepID=UPI001894B093|nr:SAM-dependent methyltransferase [Nocardia terpenica]MBF6064849.1 SAM-dependent methyltransferase [Nocardia terpenica]MBF6107364.1 SAM-dependent methyltransferase [Nocardia terpenica]MBF6115121.1 SAM-dependent methyltransferase [Nocardia terpenica]MBF6122227.1 SAM-dependent methyltransferase [Nocardia terpenica]MBF6154610.1 SAM-dependent methyltransferase [Nocardia terpenica]